MESNSRQQVVGGFVRSFHQVVRGSAKICEQKTLPTVFRRGAGPGPGPTSVGSLSAGVSVRGIHSLGDVPMSVRSTVAMALPALSSARSCTFSRDVAILIAVVVAQDSLFLVLCCVASSSIGGHGGFPQEVLLSYRLLWSACGTRPPMSVW